MIPRESAAASALSAAAAMGVVVALANFFTPDNGISGTPGALLVVGSSALVLLLGLLLRRRISRGRSGGMLPSLLALILIAGTAFAAWLLEARVLFALMVLSGLGALALLAPRRGT